MTCIIDNVNVLVQLHSSWTSTTDLLGETKAFICGENNEYLALELEKISETCGSPAMKKLRFDRCYDSCKLDVFSDTRIEDSFDFAIRGGKCMLFNIGIGINKHTAYDRAKVIALLMGILKKQNITEQENLTISFAYLGVTEDECIDLQTECSVADDLLSYGIDPLLLPIQSFSEIEEVLSNGCTLPFVLAMRFEVCSTDPTSGTLYIVDMGTPHYIPMDFIAAKEEHTILAENSVSKSFHLIRRIIAQLTSDSLLSPFTYKETYLTRLMSDFFSGNCKSLFVFNVEAPDGHVNHETVELLEFAELLRKSKIRQKLNKIDSKVNKYEEKYKQCKMELQKIQIEYRAQFEIIRQQEALLQESQDINSTFEKKNQDLIRNSAILKEQYNELQTSETTSIIDAKLSSSTKSTEIITLKEDIRKAHVNLSIVTNERDILAMKCTDFELKLVVLQNSFDLQTVEYRKYQDSKITSDLQLESVENALHTLRLAYNELKEAHDLLLEKLTTVTQNAKQTQEEKSKLEVDLQHERKRSHIQAQKVGKLQKRNASLEKQAKKEIERAEIEHENWLLEKYSGNESKVLIHKISDLEQTIRQLHAEAKDSQGTFEKQNAKLRDCIENYAIELNAAKAKNELLLAEHQIEKEHSISEKNDLTHQINDLKLKFTSVESMVKRYEAVQSGRRQENSKINDEFENLRERLLNVTNLAADTQLQLEERSSNWNNERNQLKALVESLEQKLSQNELKSSSLFTPVSKKQDNTPVMLNINADSLSLPPHSKTNSKRESVVKRLNIKPVRKRQKPSVVIQPNNLTEKPSKLGSLGEWPMGNIKLNTKSALAQPETRAVPESTPKRGRKKTNAVSTKTSDAKTKEFKTPLTQKPSNMSAIEDNSISQASIESEFGKLLKKTSQRKKITFNRKRQPLDIGSENSSPSNNPSSAPLVKKKKVTIGRKRQPIGLNIYKTSAPEILSSLTKGSSSRYSIASNINKETDSPPNKAKSRVSMLRSVKSLKLNALPNPPPILGNGHSSILDPTRKLDSRKSTSSLESIKSNFNVSKRLRK